MANIARLAIILTTDTLGMVRGFSAAGGMISGFDMKTRLLNRGTALAAAGVGAMTAAAGAFVYEGIRMASTMEQVRVQMDVLTGSAVKGGQLLRDVWTFAKETPFSFEDVARATKTLLAMGDTANEAVSHIGFLGDISAGTGQNLNELANVFGQVRQAGRLTGNELRQFNERGIPLLSELADMMGVSKAAIRGMVEESQISADMVERAFIRMTSAGGRFADMTERLNERMKGQWEKLKDSFSMMTFEAVGGSTGWLTQLMESVSSKIDELTEEIRTFNADPATRLGFHAIDMMFPGSQMSRELFIASNKAREEQLRGEMLDKRLSEIGVAPDAAERERESMQLSERIAEQAEERMKMLRKEADKLTESLRAPGETMAQSMARVNEMFERGLILPDIYGRAVEEIKNKFIEATKEKTKFFGGAGANPGVDYNTTSGAAAVNAAKAEMARMVQEQKESNLHLRKIEAAFAGVATF